MTLSGNLGFVPLDEVLRLLTRSGNIGVVEITNGGTSGRIFVADEGIGLATTFSDHDLERHLQSSGYLGHDSGAVSFSDDLLALIREMTVESIYRMDGDDADFQVVRDASSPYSSPAPFDLEQVLEDSRRRAEQWDRVSKQIPDLTAEMRVNRDLRRDTIQLDRESWRILSEIGGGSSVQDLSARLGTTDYAIASVAATMVGDDLLVMEGGQAQTEDYTEPAYVAEPAYEAEPEITAEDTTPEAGEVTAEVEVDPDRSWWDEPEADEAAAAAATESPEDAVGSPDGSEDAEDTDAFLEKVFSEVGNDTSEEDGHGLMRRRRMGSILRELGED